MVAKPNRTGSPVVGCCQVRAASAVIAALSSPSGGRCRQQLADHAEAQARLRRVFPYRPNRYAAAMTTRRLPAPWRVEKIPGG
jgi:hypothetical protein